MLLQTGTHQCSGEGLQECGQHRPPCTPPFPGTGSSSRKGLPSAWVTLAGKGEKALRGSGRFSTEETQQSQVNFAQCHGTGRSQVPTQQSWAFPALAWVGLWVSFVVLPAGASWDLWEYMGSLLPKERAGGLCQQGKSWEAEGEVVIRTKGYESISWKLHGGFQAVMRFLEDFLGGGGGNLVH